MRITESRIKQIIKEEAKRSLQEMPYAVIIPTGD